MKFALVEKIYAIDIKLPAIGGTEAKIQDVLDFITKTLIPIALDLAIIIGTLMIFYSAFLYVTSFGEENKAETAKKTLLWSIIGTIVVALAKVIVDNVDRFLG